MTRRRAHRLPGALLVAVVLAPLTAAVLGAGHTAAAQTGPGDGGSPPAGTTLRVATKPLEPFVFVDDDAAGSNPNGTQAVRGFSIDVWNEVADRLGVETEWVVLDSVGDVIDANQQGTVDAGIAGISITREREEVIDFSQPYYLSGHQIVVRQKGSGDVLRVLGRLIGSREILVPLFGLVVLVVIVSHLVWWFERGHESEDFPTDYRHGIGEALWWSTVNVVTGGEAVKNINTAVSRLIALLWMLVGLLLLAYLTARATSILTVAELQSEVNGLDDLAGRTVTTVANTESVSFLEAELGTVPVQARDVDEALADLAAGRTDAVVFDSGVAAYAVNQRYRTQLQLVTPLVGRDPYGIALPSGSPWRERIDGAVIEMGRDGTLDRLERQWFGTS